MRVLEMYWFVNYPPLNILKVIDRIAMKLNTTLHQK